MVFHTTYPNYIHVDQHGYINLFIHTLAPYTKGKLGGGLEHFLCLQFSIQLGMSSSQVTFIFFRGVG